MLIIISLESNTASFDGVQEHYEKLSNKARAKPRSPSRSSSQDEDLGERLDAKLQATEKKRYKLDHGLLYVFEFYMFHAPHNRVPCFK